MRSLSLSLDSLLDYTDKDVEESTLEVCLYGFLLSIIIVFSITELCLNGTVSDFKFILLVAGLWFCSFHCLLNHFMKCSSFKWAVEF